jgi:hypothetical protein
VEIGGLLEGIRHLEQIGLAKRRSHELQTDGLAQRTEAAGIEKAIFSCDGRCPPYILTLFFNPKPKTQNP